MTTAEPAGLGLLPVHLDLTNWKGDRLFIGEAAALGQLIAWLRCRRLGDTVSASPLGILTHHLIMDRETAGFLERLLRLIVGHCAARWVAIDDMLQ